MSVISYFDGANGDLKVDACGNADCTLSSTLTTVANATGSTVPYCYAAVAVHDANNQIATISTATKAANASDQLIRLRRFAATR